MLLKFCQVSSRNDSKKHFWEAQTLLKKSDIFEELSDTFEKSCILRKFMGIWITPTHLSEVRQFYLETVGVHTERKLLTKKVTSWWLVVNSHFETSWAHVDKLDRSFGLDSGTAAASTTSFGTTSPLQYMRRGSHLAIIPQHKRRKVYEVKNSCPVADSAFFFTWCLTGEFFRQRSSLSPNRVTRDKIWRRLVSVFPPAAGPFPFSVRQIFFSNQQQTEVISVRSLVYLFTACGKLIFFSDT